MIEVYRATDTNLRREVAIKMLPAAFVPSPGGYRKIVTLGNLGRSWYRALQIKATRSTGRLQTVTSYTRSRAEDMARYQLPEDSRDITWGDDRNGTTQNDARPDGRNTGRTGAYRNVDLRVTRRVPAGTRVLEAVVEAFNVFTAINDDEYVGALSSPLFGRPVSACPSRRVPRAAVLRF